MIFLGFAETEWTAEGLLCFVRPGYASASVVCTLRLCAPGHASAYSLEGYKTVVILETPFWVAGAAESMKISIIVIGASNKSGRH